VVTNDLPIPLVKAKGNRKGADFVIAATDEPKLFAKKHEKQVHPNGKSLR
jgi:hypothetical protein